MIKKLKSDPQGLRSGKEEPYTFLNPSPFLTDGKAEVQGGRGGGEDCPVLVTHSARMHKGEIMHGVYEQSGVPPSKANSALMTHPSLLGTMCREA